MNLRNSIIRREIKQYRINNIELNNIELIRKKLYAIIDNNDKVIIKAAGAK